MHLVCTKYELIYSNTKSKDRFFFLFGFFLSPQLFIPAVRTLGLGRGRAVGLQVAGEAGLGSAPTCRLPAEGGESLLRPQHPRELGKKRKQTV